VWWRRPGPHRRGLLEVIATSVSSDFLVEVTEEIAAADCGGVEEIFSGQGVCEGFAEGEEFARGAAQGDVFQAGEAFEIRMPRSSCGFSHGRRLFFLHKWAPRRGRPRW